MATFKNTSGAKLIVNDEFGLPVSFEPGETKANVSNYLERYTSTFQSGLDILLKRIGTLDLNVNEGGVPVAVIEEENMAVRPSQPNQATQGVFWGEPGKSNTAIPAGYGNPLISSSDTNSSTRLQRIGFNTQDDIQRRQIDTRFLDVKPDIDIAVSQRFTDGAAVSIAGGTAAVDFDTASTIIKINGRRATAADCANEVYGSLLTEGTYYTAFGSIVCHDDSESATETIGFRLIGINDEAFTAFTDVAWTAPALAVTDADTITMTITGGAASDTVLMTANFAQHIATSAAANLYYDSDDELRGWYAVSAHATTGAAAGVLLMTDNGVLQILHGDQVDFTAWT